nr:unknown [Vibrio phage 1]
MFAALTLGVFLTGSASAWLDTFRRLALGFPALTLEGFLPSKRNFRLSRKPFAKILRSVAVALRLNRV